MDRTEQKLRRAAKFQKKLKVIRTKPSRPAEQYSRSKAKREINQYR